MSAGLLLRCQGGGRWFSCGVGSLGNRETEAMCNPSMSPGPKFPERHSADELSRLPRQNQHCTVLHCPGGEFLGPFLSSLGLWVGQEWLYWADFAVIGQVTGMWRGAFRVVFSASCLFHYRPFPVIDTLIYI